MQAELCCFTLGERQSPASTVEKYVLSALLLWLFITYLIEETTNIFTS